MISYAHNNAQPTKPTNRLVLLGASNLTLSLRLVIQLMQQRYGQPSDVLVAAGHGRSYGEYSQVLIRRLPGITSSGLWSHLELIDTLPTYAFLTDIGNDIPYGYAPEQILGWVRWCVERLQRQAAHIVMTNIPITSIEPLSEWHYSIIRAVLFPRCQLSRCEIIDRARKVYQGLVDMASRYNFELYEQEPIWFGPDAIHILYWKRKALYQRIVEQLPASSTRIAQKIVSNETLFSLGWKQRPQFAYKEIFRRKQWRAQPSGQLAGNTTVSLY